MVRRYIQNNETLFLRTEFYRLRAFPFHYVEREGADRLRVLPVFICINGVLYNIALCKGADGSFPIAVIPIVVLPFRADILLWLSVFGIGKPYRLPRFDRPCCALDIDHLTGDGSQRVYLGGFMVIEIINAIGIVPYSVQGECRGNQRKT